MVYLGTSTAGLESELVDAFRQGLRDLGYIEGQNIVIDYRWADGHYDRFPALVADAVRLKADVILTAGTPGTLAAKEGTSTIPIVIAGMGDPMGAGVVPSLARPGGNITGSASMTPEIDGKRLELLKELAPGVSRVALLWNPSNPNNTARLERMQSAAQTLHIKLGPLVGVGSGEDLDRGLATVVAARAEALLMGSDRALLAHRAQIVEFAARRRLPALYAYRELVEAGGLASYAPSYPAIFRRAATYVDRSSRARSPATCRSSSPRDSSSPSTSRPPRLWG